MSTETKRGGIDKGRPRAATLMLVALAMVASLFAIPQFVTEAGAASGSDSGAALVTLSAPESCVSPYWDFVNDRGESHITDPYDRTTLGFVFEPGHHFFRVQCAGGEKYRYGVVGPANDANRFDEILWGHRVTKCRDCQVTIFHPAHIAVDVPEAGYVEPVTWSAWLDEARRQMVAVDLAFLDQLAERELIRTAAIIVEPNGAVRVSVSHIGL